MTAVTRNTEYDVAVVGGGAAGGMAETTWLDATAQADLVRRGEVSPKELAEAGAMRTLPPFCTGTARSARSARGAQN